MTTKKKTASASAAPPEKENEKVQVTGPAWATAAGAAKPAENPQYVLRLYTSGATAMSHRAIVNIRQICEEFLQGRYELEVVDISQNAALAAGEQIIAVPTLIKKLPLPLRRFIGDMSKKEQLLVGLDLRERKDVK